MKGKMTGTIKGFVCVPHLFCIFMILFIVCLGLIAGGCMMDVVNDPSQMLI